MNNTMRIVEPVLTVEDCVNMIGSQHDVGELYIPTVTQQSVYLWIKNNRVPSGRVTEFLMELRRRGFKGVEAGNLNPDFAAFRLK